MKKHPRFTPLIIILIAITAFTSIVSLTALILNLENVSPTGGITGLSVYEEQKVSSETFELYEGYSKEIDINQDSIPDAEITLKYSDEGLAILKINHYKDSC